jgi:hydroxymethylglutaryl-CoA reductase
MLGISKLLPYRDVVKLGAKNFSKKIAPVTGTQGFNPTRRPVLSPSSLTITRFTSALSVSVADKLSENVIGVATADVAWGSVRLGNRTFQLPALGKSYEKKPLAVLAASQLTYSATKSIVNGQIQLIANSAVFPFESLERVLREKGDVWEAIAKSASGGMVARGGGPCGFHLSRLPTPVDAARAMAVLNLDVDVCDAMGANCLNAISEAVSVQMAQDLPEEIKVGMRILTNACPTRRIYMTVDIPYSQEMQHCQQTWDRMSPLERLYPFARGMTDMAKVTANDSRAVLAALAYDLHVTGVLPLDLLRTETGFQLRINAPAPFGSVGRLKRFPAAVDALSRMDVKTSADIALHAAVLGTLETVFRLSQLSSNASIVSTQSALDSKHVDRSLMPGAPMTAKLRDLDIEGRRDALGEFLGSGTDFRVLDGRLPEPVAHLAFPIGVLPNLLLNGRYLHFLAVTEEPSVVAGTCYGLKLLSHGLTASLRSSNEMFELELNVKIPVSALSRGRDYSGEYVRDAVVSGCHFARISPERATTNNKGFDNGMAAAAMAMGWDDVLLSLNMHAASSRVVEAPSSGAASRKAATYGPIVDWYVGDDGELMGRCHLSVSPAVIGDGMALSCRDLAHRCLSGTVAESLSSVVAAGMAVHLASLIALGTKGIQANHMVFHAR